LEALKTLRGGDGPSPSSRLKARGDEPSPPRTFWEEDYFDRYLRDDEHYRRVVRYIENNPTKARLVKAPEDWPWSSARYRGEPGPVVPVLTHPTAKRTPSPNV
jgi:hypothetical protein